MDCFNVISEGVVLSPAADMAAAIEAARLCAGLLGIMVYVESAGIIMGCCGPDGVFEARRGRADN